MVAGGISGGLRALRAPVFTPENLPGRRNPQLPLPPGHRTQKSKVWGLTLQRLFPRLAFIFSLEELDPILVWDSSCDRSSASAGPLGFPEATQLGRVGSGI